MTLFSGISFKHRPTPLIQLSAAGDTTCLNKYQDKYEVTRVNETSQLQISRVVRDNTFVEGVWMCYTTTEESHCSIKTVCKLLIILKILFLINERCVIYYVIHRSRFKDILTVSLHSISDECYECIIPSEYQRLNYLTPIVHKNMKQKYIQ